MSEIQGSNFGLHFQAPKSQVEFLEEIWKIILLGELSEPNPTRILHQMSHPYGSKLLFTHLATLILAST